MSGTARTATLKFGIGARMTTSSNAKPSSFVPKSLRNRMRRRTSLSPAVPVRTLLAIRQPLEDPPQIGPPGPPLIVRSYQFKPVPKSPTIVQVAPASVETSRRAPSHALFVLELASVL